MAKIGRKLWPGRSGDLGILYAKRLVAGHFFAFDLLFLGHFRNVEVAARFGALRSDDQIGRAPRFSGHVFCQTGELARVD